METKERCGRFVLQFEDARTSAGSFFRAVQVGPSGYEKHVQIFRSERLAPEAAQAVSAGLSQGLQVQHAQVGRGLEVGQAGRAVFVAYELVEGRPVSALLERSRREQHPFAPDHALLIVSKAAAALEGAQSRKRIHGFLLPECVHVSHDGEVTVRGFGLPARVLREANCVGVREATFMAPEVETANPLDIRADIFSLGAQLFEMLTGSPLPRDASTLHSLEAARIASPGTDGAPIPRALRAVLAQALAEDPEKRFKDAATFKKAVDTLLFSGDYSPTTFNLAFFMHTLFRDEGDEDAQILKAERAADYGPYLASGAEETLVFDAPPPLGPGRETSPATSRSGETPRPVPAPAEPARPPAKSDTSRSGRVPLPAATVPVDESSGRVAVAESKGFPVTAVAVAVAVIAVLGIAGYLLTRPGSPGPATPTPAPTMNAAENAALARVRELEVRLAALEAEKSAAEQAAADQAKARIEAQARARGRAVDPLEVQAAQDEARRKAQAEQASKLQTERQKIEEERRLADEARLAEAAPPPPSVAPSLSAATPAPTPTPVATPVSTPTPAPPQAATPPATPVVRTAGADAGTADAASASSVLDPADPNVVAAQLVSQPRIEYPPLARAQKMTGSVLISALIDEQGNVIETRVIRGAPSNTGFNQAALNNVKGRKYKPATLNGKPGRTWVAIKIDFRL